MKNKTVSTLALFAFLSWLHMLTETWSFFHAGMDSFGFNLPALFHTLSWVSYSFIYLLPSLLLPALLVYLAPSHNKLIAGVAVAGTAFCILFIRVDSTIYDLYNFHFNGFALNLLITPGGIDSLGGGNDTYVVIGLIVLSKVIIQAALMATSLWILRSNINIFRWRWVIMLLLVAMVGEHVIYGISDIKNDGAILDTAKVYPFYERVTFRGIAAKLGIKLERSDKVGISVDTMPLHYPLHPIVFHPVTNPPNIVVLVAESLRWDRLTPRIMPNTWKLAQRGQQFSRHYSSGNGTREGLFGMFYGLYGSYWGSFLHAQHSPLLMDRIQELNYQLDLRTSARFSYPEFNKTLFAKIPLQQLHEDFDSEVPWKRDELNASALIKFIDERDRSRPFMSFFFFESTHARYSFPDSSIIARPYLENVNYGVMSKASLAPNIDQLLNRYTNSAHWVDQQLGRIYDELEKQGLLDSTIIIVTGDHGEEFLEKGFWGHNSTFVEEQTHTPMVVWMPGMTHHEIDRVTSHMDIGTTLLQLLGAPADAESYTLGRNLFDKSSRPYIVSSDWHSIDIITADMKYRIPYNNRGHDHWQPTKLDDTSYSSSDSASILEKNRNLIIDAIKNSSKFSRKNAH